MIIRQLDQTGDWTFGKGKNNFLTQNSAIGLNISTRLNSWLNDCFFAMTAGIDWLNRMGLKNQKQLLENDIRRIITQSYGVTAILSFSISQTGRKFSAQYTVQTIYNTAYNNSITFGV